VMTPAFFNRFSRGIHEKIQDLGATFALPERPLEEIFTEEHFKETQVISIGRHAPALKLMPLPMRIAVRLMKAFATGYTVRVFAPE
jgi:hypothetical protein